jgi:ABC-2 type transport system ATP-binding protein
MNVIETARLGKRYGHAWALRDCTFTMPEGHLAALVGPNGAGKTTLLHLLVGLIRQDEGTAAVLGGLTTGSRAALDAVAFVAQDTPVYTGLTAANMIRVARNLNRGFDEGYAHARLGELGIPLGKKAARLSGGQRAQLALTVALARRPRLLILDEPLSSLDPLARHDFMATVLTAMSEDGVSVLLSSHVLAELERVADYLVLLAKGQVQVADRVEDLLARHRVLTGPAADADHQAASLDVVQDRRAEAQAHLLVRTTSPNDPVPVGWESHPVSMEELVLAYLRDSAAPGPSLGALKDSALKNSALKSRMQEVAR